MIHDINSTGHYGRCRWHPPKNECAGFSGELSWLLTVLAERAQSNLSWLSFLDFQRTVVSSHYFQPHYPTSNNVWNGTRSMSTWPSTRFSGTRCTEFNIRQYNHYIASTQTWTPGRWTSQFYTQKTLSNLMTVNQWACVSDAFSNAFKHKPIFNTGHKWIRST